MEPTPESITMDSFIHTYRTWLKIFQRKFAISLWQPPSLELEYYWKIDGDDLYTGDRKEDFGDCYSLCGH